MAGSFREAEHAGWMARGESYDALFSAITKQAIPHVLAALGDLAGTAVLDVCCGPGHFAAAAAGRGAAVEGVDFAAAMVARARRNHPTLRFREGDAENLPFEDGGFDHVVCLFGIMHLARPEAAMAEAHRVLRPGGSYAFTQWAQDDDLLRIVAAALAAHGGAVDLPPAPPPMRFSDPDECRRALHSAGLRAVGVARLDLQWRTDRAADILDLIHSGAVRAALLLDAQAPARRARIHEAIIEAAEARRAGSEIILRRPAVLASGTKAA